MTINSEIHIDNCVSTPSEFITFLGVTLDPHVKFNFHINSVIKKTALAFAYSFALDILISNTFSNHCTMHLFTVALITAFHPGPTRTPLIWHPSFTFRKEQSVSSLIVHTLHQQHPSLALLKFYLSHTLFSSNLVFYNSGVEQVTF